jgi:hypothetical protein
MLAFFAGAIVGMVERRNAFMEPKLLQDGSIQFQGLDSRGNPGDHLLQNLDPLGRFGDLPRIGAHDPSPTTFCGGFHNFWQNTKH